MISFTIGIVIALSAITPALSHECPFNFVKLPGEDVCLFMYDDVEYATRRQLCSNIMPLEKMMSVELDKLLRRGLKEVWVEVAIAYEDGPFVEPLGGGPLFGPELWTSQPTSNVCVVYSPTSRKLTTLACDQGRRASVACLADVQRPGRLPRGECAARFFAFRSPKLVCVTQRLVEAGTRQELDAKCVEMGGIGLVSASFVHYDHPYLTGGNIGVVEPFPLAKFKADDPFPESFFKKRNNLLFYIDSKRFGIENANNLRTYKNYYCEDTPGISNEIVLTINDCDGNTLTVKVARGSLSDVICLTDSITYHPVPVTVTKINTTTGRLETPADGYYWCVSSVATKDVIPPSKKVLWIDENSSLDDVQVVLLKARPYDWRNASPEWK